MSSKVLTTVKSERHVVTATTRRPEEPLHDRPRPDRTHGPRHRRRPGTRGGHGPGAGRRRRPRRRRRPAGRRSARRSPTRSRATGTASCTSTSPTRPAGRTPSTAAASDFGGLDILVNNAGVEITSLITEVDPKDIRTMLEVNVLGTALGLKWGLRTMRPDGLGRQGRQHHQHLLGRRDDRLPGHPDLLGHQVRGRPAHPGRGDGVRQARLRRTRQLRLPRPGPHGHGRGPRQRHGRARPVRLPGGGGRRGHRAHPVRPPRRGRRHGRRRGLPGLRRARGSSTASACPVDGGMGM